MEFHERVKAIRNEVLKIQQGQLANMIGISQSCLPITKTVDVNVREKHY